MDKRAEIKESAMACARSDWEDGYVMNNPPTEALFFSDRTEYNEVNTEEWWMVYYEEYERLNTNNGDLVA